MPGTTTTARDLRRLAREAQRLASTLDACASEVEELPAVMVGRTEAVSALTGATAQAARAARLLRAAADRAALQP